MNTSSCRIQLVRSPLVLGLVYAFVIPAPAWQLAEGLNAQADFALKETYDSNVYLQDTDPGTNGVFPAKKGSWITTVSPRLVVTYKPGPEFNLSASYAPDLAWYHNARSEDHIAHRIGLTLGGKAGDALWEQANALTLTDGSHLGPLFARPQDVPAVGGIPLRDRRDALVYRGGFKLTWPVGKFFLRPTGSAYLHDFGTEQRLAGQVAPPRFYVNYNDRQDVNGGLDLGMELAEKTFGVVGYRYGRQDQFRGPNPAGSAFTDSPYDSAYHRILFGVEGAPAPWIKLAVLGGPEIRDFYRTSALSQPAFADFDRHELLYWIDATVTLLPTKQDSIVLLNRRYEQPAFTSQSVYEDITYSVTWKHQFNEHWSAQAGFQLYIGDWQAPVAREDWIYTPSVGLTYIHDAHLSVAAAYAYDWVENQVTPVPGDPKTQWAAGREYTRHLVSLSLKYVF